MSPAAFNLWLLDAKPGDQITYYKGHLAFTRSLVMAHGHTMKRIGFEADQIANHVYALSDGPIPRHERDPGPLVGLGLVTLLQNRVGINQSDYIAVRLDDKRDNRAIRAILENLPQTVPQPQTASQEGI